MRKPLHPAAISACVCVCACGWLSGGGTHSHDGERSNSDRLKRLSTASQKKRDETEVEKKEINAFPPIW